MRQENEKLQKEISRLERELEKAEETMGIYAKDKISAEKSLAENIEKCEELQETVQDLSEKINEQEKTAKILTQEVDNKEKLLQKTESINKVKLDTELGPLGMVVRTTNIAKMGRSKSMMNEQLHNLLLDQKQIEEIQNEEKLHENQPAAEYIPEDPNEDNKEENDNSEKDSAGSLVVNEKAQGPSIFCKK